MEPGPTPTFTAPTPRSTSARAPSSVATFLHQLVIGERVPQARNRLEHAIQRPRAESTTMTSHPAESAGRAGSPSAAHSAGDAQPAVLILFGEVLPALGS
jgi:hypothetical protein